METDCPDAPLKKELPVTRSAAFVLYVALVLMLLAGLAVRAAAQDSPGIVLPPDRPMNGIVGTAFGPQPAPCYSEACQPLPARGPDLERWSAWAGYLLWRVKSGPIGVPLVTSTTADPPDIFSNTGVLGRPDTIILAPPSNLDFGTFNGLRIGIGYEGAADASGAHAMRFEAIGFFLERRSDGQVYRSDEQGNPVLSIPFFRVNEGRPQGESRFIVAFPSNFAGQIAYSAGSQFWGAELNAAFGCLNCGAPCQPAKLELIVGGRYLGLKEGFNFGSQSTTIGTDFITTFGFEEVSGVGVTVGHQESFDCQNSFLGPQVGVRGEYTFGKFFVSGSVKVALGLNQQTIEVNGHSFLIREPGAAVETLPGGFFASPTNLGRHFENKFSVVPELGVSVGFQLTDCARVSVGYSFLYWTNVVRPGNQLDRGLNTGGLPLAEFFGDPLEPARPGVPFYQSNFWAQGVNFALEVKF
jgi:hypothetical protein